MSPELSSRRKYYKHVIVLVIAKSVRIQSEIVFCFVVSDDDDKTLNFGECCRKLRATYLLICFVFFTLRIWGLCWKLTVVILSNSLFLVLFGKFNEFFIYFEFDYINVSEFYNRWVIVLNCGLWISFKVNRMNGKPTT